MSDSIVDAHVHFWDPVRLVYPWLDGLPSLQRAFRPADHSAYSVASGIAAIDGMIFVEANPRPDLAFEEVRLVEDLADADPRIEGIVAFVDLLDTMGLERSLDALANRPRVRGIRHNIQGNAPGFAVQRDFVAGVREAGRRGLTFDLCATHDQLADVVTLARSAKDCRLVLDHCGKPAIRAGGWDPWAGHIRELSTLPYVSCKISGLLTEADLENWHSREILPYVEHVVECFGTGRVMYGSDWPVSTLADRAESWYPMISEWTGGWSRDDRARFFRDNARDFYGLRASNTAKDGSSRGAGSYAAGSFNEGDDATRG